MQTNKRKSIEIYFILYLAALVILVPSQKEKNSEMPTVAINKMDFPFVIKAEKPMLICKISTDVYGNKIIEVDSLNYIWDIGDVKDVRYEFVIEDQTLNHSVRLSNNLSNQNKFFRFTEDK
jgi:hypothetical protein